MILVIPFGYLAAVYRQSDPYSFRQLPVTILPSPPTNLVSLSDALFQLFEAKTHDTCTCLATITEIEAGDNRSWYLCLQHGTVEIPNCRYRFSAIIADATCTAKAVFFDKVAASLVGTISLQPKFVHDNNFGPTYTFRKRHRLTDEAELPLKQKSKEE
ncbi:hypothetical protein L1987_10830 [Smallanthus sonchifolius]|uniref:Uncharacterized protein n=1 Tax=Smallanthus sonchifolius TaxID=185202 RepID=A0ACB9J9A9_9ASTR|nr:hypothetical protein L1987_10830 [Smallanthus sonchifolius]